MKILIATKNPAKAKEIKKYLRGNFETVTLADFPNAPDVEETGKTFEENAFLKAKKYFEFYGLPAVADDGGLEIDYLGGEPGVKSRRWPGYEASDEELMKMAIEKLKGVPWEKRTARLRAVGIYFDGKRTISATDKIEGFIVEEKPESCEPGFPFRSMLWIPQFKKLYRDLSEEEHTKVNHRKVIYEKIAEGVELPD